MLLHDRAELEAKEKAVLNAQRNADDVRLTQLGYKSEFRREFSVGFQ